MKKIGKKKIILIILSIIIIFLGLFFVSPINKRVNGNIIDFCYYLPQKERIECAEGYIECKIILQCC
jgi:hypothetical protein